MQTEAKSKRTERESTHLILCVIPCLGLVCCAWEEERIQTGIWAPLDFFDFFLSECRRRFSVQFWLLALSLVRRVLWQWLCSSAWLA